MKPSSGYTFRLHATNEQGVFGGPGPEVVFHTQGTAGVQKRGAYLGFDRTVMYGFEWYCAVMYGDVQELCTKYTAAAGHVATCAC